MVTATQSVKKFKSYIGGQWIDSAQTFENRNPAHWDDVLGLFPRGGKKEVEQAVQAAKKAFPAWSKTPPPVRSRILFRAAELLADKKDEIAKVIVKEMGKTLPESKGDVQAAIDMAQFVAGEGRRLYGETTYSELPNRWALTRRVPLGIVGIITAWNAPMATPAWKIFPALLCGNVIIFKPAEDTPHTAQYLVEILKEAGLPDGVLNMVHGLGEEAGSAIVEHPDISLLSFTGSSEVGHYVAQEGAKRLAKVSLELGGKNAAIIMDDANVDLTIKGMVSGAFSVAGQRCAATSRAIVHEKVYEEFMQKFKEAASNVVLGDGMDPKTQVCPLINKAQVKRVKHYVQKGIEEGATLEMGGKAATGPGLDGGLFFEPTIFTNVKPSMTIARDEIFGPVLCVFKVSSYDEAMKIHNDVPYGLTASIFTSNVNVAVKGLDDMEAGVCYVNAPTFGSEVHMPFGGVKASGNGWREAGMGGIEVFSETKTIYIDYSDTIQNAQFLDPKKK